MLEVDKVIKNKKFTHESSLNALKFIYYLTLKKMKPQAHMNKLQNFGYKYIYDVSDY